MSGTDTLPRWAQDHGERLARLEQIASDTRGAIERLDRSIERLDQRVDKLGDKIDRAFYWLLTLFLGGIAGMLGAIAKGFHWV